jgi:hypothetical protein
METHWFDPTTGDWLSAQYITERPSFRTIVADTLITVAAVANNGNN